MPLQPVPVETLLNRFIYAFKEQFHTLDRELINSLASDEYDKNGDNFRLFSKALYFRKALCRLKPQTAEGKKLLESSR